MEAKQIVSVIKKIPILARFGKNELRSLATSLKQSTFSDGEDIVKEGDEGDEFFVIVEGKALVSKNGEELAVLNPGDFFGEASLVNNAPRGATITAKAGGVKTLSLNQEQFNRLFSDKKTRLFAKRQAISAEANNNKFVVSEAAQEPTPKTDAQTTMILNAVSENVLFYDLDIEQKQKVVAAMHRRVFKSGTDIIVQGDQGATLYVLESGTCAILVNGENVATYGPGMTFGELALMYNAPRAATVRAMEGKNDEIVTWEVDRFTFRRIVSHLSEQKFSIYCGFLRNVELLAALSQYERQKIAEAIEQHEFKAGSILFNEGDEGHSMFMMYSGTVDCYKTINGKEDVVASYKRGEYFGERALLQNEARAATVKARTQCICLSLDRAAFEFLLGPVKSLMELRESEYKQVEEQLANASIFSSGDDTPSISAPDRSSLVTIGTLGKGSFGHVTLVQDPSTGTTYALKAVSKAQIVATQQQAHIISEKEAMAAFNHPFIVRLHATYKDQDRLYFLLEPSLGGELFSVLRAKTMFDDATARFYGGSVLLAFEYMHSLDYVYRDLKPENLLLNNHGILKVTDFGFAKKLGPSARTWTLCGTPDYLAPEIVSGKGHGKGVDWWTLGIFIFEMLASFPPFYDEDPMLTYNRIMKGKIKWPSHFATSAKKLCKGLLHPVVTKRLGVIMGGADTIKKQDWFSGFSFSELLEQKLTPPIIPTVASATDISNFDDYGDDDPIEPYADDGSNWDADF